MADPVSVLTAVGAVSNVLQIADFSGKVAYHAVKLMSSGEGLQENVEIETLTREHKELTQGILGSEAWTQQANSNSSPLMQRAKRMNQQAGELLGLLEGLKVAENSKGLKRLLESTKQSAKALRNRSKIERKQTELGKATGQLAIVLLQHIAEHQTTIVTDSDKRKWDEIQRTLSDMTSHAASVDAEEQRKWREVQDALNKMIQIDEGRKEIERMAAQEQTKKAKVEKVVKSLKFQEMDSRHDTVMLAYEKTYDWAVRNQDSKLRHWLAQGSGIFWICGKPGSGKSTFMKCLLHHAETASLLKSWTSPDQRVMIAEFFFWYLGTPMQRSIRGLLQVACPGRLIFGKDPDDYDEPVWSEEELFQAARTIARAEGRTPDDFRLTLFIDGLDEFDGNHFELVSVLQELAAGEHIKICVSCRPWNVFLNAISDSPLVIKLEDLTHGDIEHYVRDNLTRAEKYQRDRSALFSRRTPQAERLVQAVVEKASGVFLWVFLVVRSLIHGYEEGDTIDIMQKRLDELPAELIPYFTLMLSRMDTVYRRILATAFAITSVPRRIDPQTVHAISFLDLWPMVHDKDHFEDELFAFRLEMTPCSAEEIQQMKEETAHLIRSSCRDFLHIIEKPNLPCLEKTQVDFIHRTVYDFLNLRDIREMLDDLRPRHLDNAQLPLYLTLARTKFVPISDPNGPCQHVAQMAECICLARLCDPAVVKELDEVEDRYIENYCPSSCPIHAGTPAATTVDRHLVLLGKGLHRTIVRTFTKRLAAAQEGVQTKSLGASGEENRIIRHAFGGNISLGEGFDRLNIDLLSSLLSRGASPDEMLTAFVNYRKQRRHDAPLAVFIRKWLLIPRDPSLDDKAWSAVRLLVERGAKVPKVCLVPTSEHLRSVAVDDLQQSCKESAAGLAWQDSNAKMRSVQHALRLVVPEARIHEIDEVLEGVKMH
ncbi:hypothetical protein PRZ48_011642 [Zasmidium cellare]|uniref:NACHT domain-containing protein n=1 Tax=Zasmidium cellare TaxID=395010 RepID=A0ABR0E6Y1_ZASCE|nr:hypothetical protein PRZ48_011642 [Zasmidium cellare]